MTEAIQSGHISGNGTFTKRVHSFFESRYTYRKTLLTSSCTDALEICALLCDFKDGDEVIIPSFTFVSTANAFQVHGATIRFADSEVATPCIDAGAVEALITSRTKAIVIVHYAGISCDMDALCAIARGHELLLIEDAAHAIDSHWRGRPLGSFGQLATFSFHETKNLTCGEGGLLILNDAALEARAEILWEKGTNRSAYFRGEVDKYRWVDLGSSFLASDISAAYLYAQLENLERIQARRLSLWYYYLHCLHLLEQRGKCQLPAVRPNATVNGHLFYILCGSRAERDRLLLILNQQEIGAVTHYLPLHESPFFQSRHDDRKLPNSTSYSERLLRLPLYFELTHNQQDRIISTIYQFFGLAFTPTPLLQFSSTLEQQTGDPLSE